MGPVLTRAPITIYQEKTGWGYNTNAALLVGEGIAYKHLQGPGFPSEGGAKKSGVQRDL